MARFLLRSIVLLAALLALLGSSLVTAAAAEVSPPAASSEKPASVVEVESSKTVDAAPSPSPSQSKTERDLAKIDAAYDKSKEKLTQAYEKTKEGVEDAYKKTKAGINRALDWIKDDKEIAETKLMAARPSAALLKKYKPASEAASSAVADAAGTSVTVPGGATVAHARRKGDGTASTVTLDHATSVDVTSGAELSAALAAGEVQPVADALLGLIAEQKTPAPPAASKDKGNATTTAAVSLVNEGVADAVTELILTTREAPAAPPPKPDAAAAPAGASSSPLPRLEALGAAFGAAMREAAFGAEITPKLHAPGAKPLSASPLAIADSLVAGIQGAAVPCAADVEGPGAPRNTSAWYVAAAKKCCGPVALATMRSAQAAVNDGPEAARVALYSALSRSVDLGGPGSFALARCSPPNAKE